jgi:hypothetical protein
MTLDPLSSEFALAIAGLSAAANSSVQSAATTKRVSGNVETFILSSFGLLI